jgi:hypothetical protein
MTPGKMPELDDKSVALVVTSPPYFAGKEYEMALGEGLVPGSYHEYLTMLEEMFAECVRVRKLEICGHGHRAGRVPSRCAAVWISSPETGIGGPGIFEVTGRFTSGRPGLTRSDTSWKALSKAAALRETHPDVPLVLFTTQLPTPGSVADVALKVLVGPQTPVRDLIVLTVGTDLTRLRDLAAGAALG